MHEIELKFQIPEGRLNGVRAALAALAGDAGKPMTMHAAYMDTPDGRLASHKMAVRIRREGARWVQTFKAAGVNAMTRLEDNQRLPDDGPMRLHGQVVADLTLHQDTTVRAALERALGPGACQTMLAPLYETVFERRTAELRLPSGVVQLCLDEGQVRAAARSEPLAELEFELLDGHAAAVIEAARAWVLEHGLWLDVQSKAYRGVRLAEAARSSQPLSCRPVLPAACPPRDAMDEAEWVTVVLNQTFETVSGNLAEVAWQRAGWEAALAPWRDTLSQFDRLAAGEPALQRALTADTWQAVSGIVLALKSPDASLPELARSAPATQCSLNLLSAIVRP